MNQSHYSVAIQGTLIQNVFQLKLMKMTQIIQVSF